MAGGRSFTGWRQRSKQPVRVKGSTDMRRRAAMPTARSTPLLLKGATNSCCRGPTSQTASKCRQHRRKGANGDSNAEYLASRPCRLPTPSSLPCSSYFPSLPPSRLKTGLLLWFNRSHPAKDVWLRCNSCTGRRTVVRISRGKLSQCSGLHHESRFCQVICGE